jgi:hypothetical protein
MDKLEIEQSSFIQQTKSFRRSCAYKVHGRTDRVIPIYPPKLCLQASTLTFVRLSGTSENWRRTSRSCITVVRRDKWKSQIPKRACTMDKSISTGIKDWVCCIKEPCLIPDLSIIYFDPDNRTNVNVEACIIQDFTTFSSFI